MSGFTSCLKTAKSHLLVLEHNISTHLKQSAAIFQSENIFLRFLQHSGIISAKEATLGKTSQVHASSVSEMKVELEDNLFSTGKMGLLQGKTMQSYSFSHILEWPISTQHFSGTGRDANIHTKEMP